MLIFLVSSAPVAIPLNNPASWIMKEDYPKEMLKDGRESSVSVVLYVGRNGLVKRCAVSQRSEIEKLNAHTCFILKYRARFENFRPPEKHRIYKTKIKWTLP